MKPGAKSKRARARSRKAQPQAAQLPNVSAILWILSILVASIGVFWLPWHFSSKTPAVGESYALGFNNHLAVETLGLSILLGTAACCLGARRSTAYTWFQVSPRLFPPWKDARGEYWILVSLCVIMAVGLLFWTSYLADPSWCEARTFLHGMDLVAVGQAPYRDFMYVYGPAFIYFPLWLSNICGGLLSFEQAYAISLILFSIGGLVALFVYIRSFELPKPRRILVTGVAMVIWVGGTTLGMQYTPLRYYIVPASLVFLDAIATRQGGGGMAGFVRVGLAAAIAVAAGLATSPEMGIATTLGVFGYGFILMLRRSIPGAAACALAAVLVFAATALVFPGYFDSVLSFSVGAYNFPVYPDVHNLCVVAISLIILPRLIASALTNPIEQRAPLALALAFAGGMLLPPALGRCDPGHVASNSLILALIMFPAAAGAGKIAFRLWTTVYAVLYVLLLQVSYWNTYTGNFTFAFRMHDFYQTHPELIASWKARWDALLSSSPYGRNLHWSKVLPFPEELNQIASRGRTLMTGACEGNMWLSRYLLLQKEPPCEYFDAFGLGASTPAEIDRRVREDLAYKYLMVPESVLAPLQGQVNLEAYRQWTDSFLSKLFVFPVNAELKNPPYLPDTEYARKILNYYKPVGRYQGFVILEKQQAH